MGCCRSEFGMMELGSEVVFLLYHFPEMYIQFVEGQQRPSRKQLI